jgi:catechol 2,3-dioxygenase-like lactoylglutathione lyase family enzyme
MSLLKKIDHIEIVSGNLDRAIEFYEKLGPVVRRTGHHGRSVEFLIGGTVFEVHAVGTGGRGEENPGVNHIAFLVEGGLEDLEKARKELVDKGIECTEIDLVKSTGRYTFNLRDADGRRLQVTLHPMPEKVTETEEHY